MEIASAVVNSKLTPAPSTITSPTATTHPNNNNTIISSSSSSNPQQQQQRHDNNGNNKRQKTLSIVNEESHYDIQERVLSDRRNCHAIIDRLGFIAQVCPSLKIEALQTSLNVLKTKSLDVDRYLYTAKILNDSVISQHNLTHSAASSSSTTTTFQIDQEWVTKTNKHNSEKLAKLENDFKMYKNSFIKESTRIGYNELAEHFYETGNLEESLKNYLRSKDYCTTSQHILDMCMNVVKLSIEKGIFGQAYSYLMKVESLPPMQEDPALAQQLLPYKGLFALNNGRYKDAANNFLSVPFEQNISEILTLHDITVYASLCALATFSRSELKALLFSNPVFQNFLELDHELSDILHSFYKSKYTECLKKLQVITPDLFLDPYLHHHVEPLLISIRKKAIVQYVAPYHLLDLNQMARIFNTDVKLLEIELMGLIKEKQLNVRIDSAGQRLIKRKTDAQKDLLKKSNEMIDNYEFELNLMEARLLFGRCQQHMLHKGNRV